jgi:TRAP-type C4-dicarboxylate transport system permease small subunit
VLRRVNGWVDRSVEWAVIGLFMAIAVVGGLQVFCRYVLNLPLSWSEEVQIYGHIWIVFLAIPITYNRGAHIVMTLLLDRVPAGLRKIVAVAVDVAWLWLGASILFFATRLVRVAAFQMSPSLGIPMSYVYLGMIAGSAYLVLVALRMIARHVLGGGDGVEGQEAPL